MDSAFTTLQIRNKFVCGDGEVCVTNLFDDLMMLTLVVAPRTTSLFYTVHINLKHTNKKRDLLQIRKEATGGTTFIGTKWDMRVATLRLPIFPTTDLNGLPGTFGRLRQRGKTTPTKLHHSDIRNRSI